MPGLPACAGSTGGGDTTQTPGDPVKIGVLAPQTGAYTALGDDLTNGFQLYLAMHGERLGGRPVTLSFADEGETAASGKAAAQKLIDEGVLAITGVATSAVMTAVRDVVENSRVPLIGSSASPPALQGVTYIWRTSYINDEPGEALGRYFAENVQGSVFSIAADDQAGRDMVAGLLKALPRERLAGEPVYPPSRPPTRNFQPYLAQIGTSGAAAVFCSFAGSLAVDFVQQYRRAGIELPLYAPGFLTEGPALAPQGQAAAGIYTAMNYAPDLDNRANRQFTSEYQKAYDGAAPTTYAMASYDAASVLDKAIPLVTGVLTPQSLNAALGKVGQIESPRGTWQFNQIRTPQQKWYLRQVRADGPVLSNVLISELTTLG